MPSKSTYIGNGERSPALYPVETFIRDSYYKLLVDQVLCLSLSHPGQARVATGSIQYSRTAVYALNLRQSILILYQHYAPS